jgi:hypothetical protein
MRSNALKGLHAMQDGLIIIADLPRFRSPNRLSNSVLYARYDPLAICLASVVLVVNAHTGRLIFEDVQTYAREVGMRRWRQYADKCETEVRISLSFCELVRISPTRKAAEG